MVWLPWKRWGHPNGPQDFRQNAELTSRASSCRSVVGVIRKGDSGLRLREMGSKGWGSTLSSGRYESGLGMGGGTPESESNPAIEVLRRIEIEIRPGLRDEPGYRSDCEASVTIVVSLGEPEAESVGRGCVHYDLCLAVTLLTTPGVVEATGGRGRRSSTGVGIRADPCGRWRWRAGRS